MPSIVFGSYSQQELDVQYDNQAWCPSFPYEMERYRALSAQAVGLPGERDVAWGTQPAQRLDIYWPASSTATPAPVIVYVHGGGWLMLGKEDNAFAAQALTDAGCLLVVLGFPKVPHVALGGMVASVRRGVAWIGRHIVRFGGDPSRILLVGHSSGAHLVSNCLTHDWAGHEPELRGALPFAGAILASGLGELEPVRLSYRNTRLNLTAEDVARYSLLRQAPTVDVPVAVVTAGGDTDEFRRQADETAAYLERHRMLAARLHVEEHNHFNLILDLGDPASALHRLALQMAGTASPWGEGRAIARRVDP